MTSVLESPLPAAGWTAIGTSIRLVVTDPAGLGPGRTMLEADLGALDAACSRFRPDSELSRLSGAGRPAVVGPVLAGAAAVLTEGDVNPTVGLALAAAGYDREFPPVPAEGPAPRVTVLALPSWRDIVLDDATRAMTVPEGVRLDVGSTAKAWAADQAAARLAAALGCGVLVSLWRRHLRHGGTPARRLADPGAGRHRRPRGPRPRLRCPGCDRRRRAGDLEHGRPALAARRGAAASHPRPAQRAARAGVAHGLGRRGHGARCQHRQHGGDHPRPGGDGWLSGLGLAARLVAADGTVITTGGWPKEDLS